MHNGRSPSTPEFQSFKARVSGPGSSGSPPLRAASEKAPSSRFSIRLSIIALRIVSLKTTSNQEAEPFRRRYFELILSTGYAYRYICRTCPNTVYDHKIRQARRAGILIVVAVCVCINMCVYVCIYIYIHTYIHIYIYIYIYIHIHIILLHIMTCYVIHSHRWLCMYLDISLSLHIYIYINTHIYT